MDTIRKKYTTAASKAKLVEEWITEKGYYLIEEQLHNDGKWLIFRSEPLPEPETSAEDKIKALEARIEALEGKAKE